MPTATNDACNLTASAPLNRSGSDAAHTRANAARSASKRPNIPVSVVAFRMTRVSARKV